MKTELTSDLAHTIAPATFDFVFEGDVEQLTEEQLKILREKYKKLGADLLQVLLVNHSHAPIAAQTLELTAVIPLRQLVLSQIATYFQVELDQDDLVALTANHQGDYGSLVDVAVAVAQQKLVEARIIEEYELDDKNELGYIQIALKTIEAVRMLMREEQPVDMPSIRILFSLVLASDSDDDELSEHGLVTKKIVKLQRISQEELKWMGEYAEAHREGPRALPYVGPKAR